MTHLTHKFALVALSVLLTLGTALSEPAHAGTLAFNYRIDATTHLKKLNQSATVTNGSFVGSVDLDSIDDNGRAPPTGSMTLPPTTIKLKPGNVLKAATVTVRIVPVKPVTGLVSILAHPITVTATATFNIRIVSAYAYGPGLVPVNLVGNNCVTATPMSVTMSGAATPGAPADFSGIFTIPPFKTCGLATTAINQLIPGPGNTFSAHATPK